jgi:hypothetical protein
VRVRLTRFVLPFILATPQVLGAQQWTIETGGGAASFEDESAIGSGYLWGSWQGGIGALYGRAGLGGTGFESGASGQAAADLSWLGAPLGGASPWRLELRAGGTGVRGTDDYLAGEVQGEFRLHGIWQRGGIWGGAIAGRGWTDRDSAGRSVSGPALGGWVRASRATAALTLSGTHLEGEWYPEIGFQLAWSSGPIDASAVVGARGEFSADPAMGWATAAANWWFDDHWAVVLQGGGFPSDPVQGLPRGASVSLGLRLSNRRSLTLRELPIQRPISIIAGETTVRFELEQATTVELYGDWTGWEPMPMTRDGARGWVLPVRLTSGVHKFNLRVDGTRWVVPEGVRREPDGYGGEVGVLIVP